MDSAETCILFTCISIFVAVMMILLNVIVKTKEKKYIESIKVGDIFCFQIDVNPYYKRIEMYLHELTNPFEPPSVPLFFPSGTCIIKDLKKSKSGEMWVCYNLIKTPEEINIAENSDTLIKHYDALDEFLELRERVERFEL